MDYLVSKIVYFITNQGVISGDPEVQDFYKYGVEISISSLLNIALVLMLGVLINHILESIIFLAIFILIRSFTGGYHADTYFRCNLLMCVTFTLTVTINDLLWNKITFSIIIILIGITELVAAILGPIENKNKPIESSKRTRLKITGIVISTIINCIGVFFIKSHIGTMIIFTTFLVALLMIAAKIKEKGCDSCERI